MREPAAVSGELGPRDAIEALVSAWNDRETGFDRWVRGVALAFTSFGVSLEGAARLLDVSVAELQAVLSLAAMDDDDLALLAASPPPKSTWFLFASAEGDAVQAGLRALEGLGPDDSPFIAVNQAIREASGPDVLERVAAISADTLGKLAHKAKEFGALKPRGRAALVSFAQRKNSGRPYTDKQLVYLHDMLRDLVAARVVCRDSPDDDQAVCDEVLDALGG